jgi:hypothetical protein
MRKENKAGIILWRTFVRLIFYHKSDYFKEATMMKNRNFVWAGALLAVLLLVSTVLGGCAKPTESAAPATADNLIVSNAAAPAIESPTPGSPQEGIKIHGHWTIEVKNLDGTLAERREFENALTPEGRGSIMLISILSRQKSMGGWVINLGEDYKDDGPWMLGDFSTKAAILESSYAGAYQYAYRNLTIETNTNLNSPDVGKMTLKGTATAAQSGQFKRVATFFHTLDPNILPSPDYPGNSATSMYPFTFKDLDVPIVLTAGQQISVTVNISFS